MRKLILISAFVLASVSVQAGQTRSLILASSDGPAATAETVKPAATAPAPLQAAPAATATPSAATAPTAPADTATTATTTTETTTPAKTHASKSAKKTSKHGWEADEAKARRIAAKYGVYW